MGPMAPYVVTPADRAWWDRCPRAWDLGSRARRGLSPRRDAPVVDADVAALRRGLAVYYFPGMWSWERSIVRPLVSADASSDRSRTALDAYCDWAPTVDRFTPIRIDLDVDAPIADPGLPGHDLGSSHAPVRYRDRVDAAAIDDDGRCWLVRHRVTDRWADPDELALDEAALVACWAFEYVEPALSVVGILHNELQLGGPEFRRTAIELETGEVARAARRLGRTAMAMLDAPSRPEPTPAWSHCGRCPFREPCLMMNHGRDPEELLASAYERQPFDDGLEEGRLGGTSWGMGRGAAPLGSKRT
jgi:hypothetical protein